MDYHTRNELSSSLIKDSTFASFTCNTDRVKYVLAQYITTDRISKQIKDNLASFRQKVSKCSVKAKCYTEEARMQIAAKDDTQALVALRKALLYLPQDKVDLKVELYLMMLEVHHDLMVNYEGALWAIEQAIELLKEQQETGQVQDLKSKLAKALFLQATVLKKLNRPEEAAEIVQQLLTFEDDATNEVKNESEQSQTIKRENLQKLLDKLKQEVETPRYSTDLKQWRESQLEEAFSTSGFKNLAVRGSIGAAYFLDERHVKIENSENIGRHFVVIGKDVIPSGSLILAERPISIATQASVVGIKCTACHADLNFRFRPCPSCTTAVYCNKVCAQADSVVHATSCDGLKNLLHEKVGTLPVHVLQMIARVGGPEVALDIQSKLALEGYSIDEYLQEKKSGLSSGSSGKETALIDYKMACILASNEEKQSLESHVKYTIMALETAVAVIGAFGKTNLMNDAFFVPFAAQLTTNLRQLSYNVFGWTDWSADLYVGNCQALVGSLVNHSCVANTMWEWKDGVISFTTKRKVAPGEHITISYGPSDWQPYSTRQERLNHYLFGCACAACLKDAAAGSALKCTNCVLGPVVFDNPLNKVASISGKCLKCFSPHPSFEDSVDSLKASFRLAQTLHSVTAYLPSFGTVSGGVEQERKLFVSSRKLLSSLHQLGLPTGKATIKSTLAVASVLQLRCASALEKCSLEERLQLADMIDQCLPTVIPHELLSQTVMRPLFGWFNLVLKWSQEFNLTVKESNLQESVVFEARDCLHLVLQFHRRCQGALKSVLASVVKEGKNYAPSNEKVFTSIVNSQLQQLDVKLDKYREVF